MMMVHSRCRRWRARVSLAAQILLVSYAGAAPAGEAALDFPADDADQGVAVDAAAVFVIDNTVVARHDKATGRLEARWTASDKRPLVHMNSGVVHGEILVVAHSNYPFLPMTGSVEMFDTTTLEHVRSHSFGPTDGSLTWVDRHAGHWWACFVHYDDDGYKEKGNVYTRVVKMDDAFRPLEAWVLPREVLQALAPDSASGGAWGPDGRLYLSGHDKPEIYALALPKAGSTLVYAGTYAFPNEGQAIAFDRTGTGLLYGIVRKENRVVARPFETIVEGE